jgi:hypothetical protein
MYQRHMGPISTPDAHIELRTPLLARDVAGNDRVQSCWYIKLACNALEDCRQGIGNVLEGNLEKRLLGLAPRPEKSRHNDS